MSEDKYKIDGNKILFHKERVKQWMEAGSDWDKAKKIYPIYVEMSPSGACNHRCTFCAVDYIGYKTRFLDTEILGKRLKEMGELGVKSVMYAGEGEPLLHKDIAKIVDYTKKAGIDVAFTTNATSLHEKLTREIIGNVTWIKASINAGTKESYAKIHKASEAQFDLAFGNMGRAAKIREEMGLSKDEHTLGAQMVLLPENAADAVTFAKRAKAEKLDYAVIKPYSQHNSSITRTYEGMKYDEQMLKIAKELEKLNDENFNVIFRSATMEELDNEKQVYTKCQSTPHFWGYIMADGAVYGCSAYLEDDRFCYGNINDNSFKEIWEGTKRKVNLGFVNDGLDISECRRNCRMHKVNETLHELKEGDIPMSVLDEQSETPAHVNFV
jgi:GTP 3',8-cyclase